MLALEGKPITNESLMSAIQLINNQVGQKITKGVKELVTCTAERVEEWELDQTGARVFCEDPYLSIHTYGKEYKANDLKLCKRGVPVVDEGELNFVLGLAAGAMDIENAATK